jgi:demethylmenaquinone methyltransferase/2-methoxy-6-polyprenyl-1,4-benzoquinol methylase
VKKYYDSRAAEYDDWYLGRGLFSDRDRPGWEAELALLVETVEGLPAGRTLDVACGTGFLTGHLQGDVVALDASEQMLTEAAGQAPRATLVRGDALALPFPDHTFDRVFTGHFYGHLHEDERAQFLGEAARVGSELVVVDSSRANAEVDEQVQQRVLNDGSEWTVYKRYFSGTGLMAELGGGEVLLDGAWFVAVRAPV